MRGKIIFWGAFLGVLALVIANRQAADQRHADQMLGPHRDATSYTYPPTR